MIYDCLIVGAGPAGCLAALQLKRADAKIVLFEKNEVGGLVRNAQRIENAIGFPKGISGLDLAVRLKTQLKYWGIHVIKSEVFPVPHGNFFEIKVRSTIYIGRTLVLATGTRPKLLRSKGARELLGTKLFYEICELPKLKAAQRILVVGGGDAALDYALSLKERGQSPTLVTKNQLKAFPLLRHRLSEAKIPCYENCSILSMKFVDECVEIHCKKAEFTVDYVLVAIGRIAQEPCDLPRKMEGLWRVGDVHQGHYRQVQIAGGDALKAAMEITEYLNHDYHS